MNYSRDVLYIQLTKVISTIQKYNTAPLAAHGLKASLFSLISIFFSADSASFSPTSLDFCLIVLSTSMSSVSSKREPSALASLSRS